MGILLGSMNIFRLYFNEDFKYNIMEIGDILEEYSFNNFYDEEKQVNYGFVPFEYPEKISFGETSIIYGEYILFSVRYDEKRFNSRYFKTELITMKKRYMEESNKEYITKNDLEFLKNSLTNKLMKSAVPNTTIIEIVLIPEKKEIWLSVASKKIIEVISNLFRSAFDINPYQETLIEMAKRTINNPSKVDKLILLNPTMN